MVSTYMGDDKFKYDIVDSEAADHFVGSLARLESTRPANLWMITTNKSKGRIDTQGDIILQAVDKLGNRLDPIVLSDVSHCRGSPLHLISMAMLCEKCTISHFEKGRSCTKYSEKGFLLIKEDALYLRWLNDVLQTEDIEDFQAREAAHGSVQRGPCYPDVGNEFKLNVVVLRKGELLYSDLYRPFPPSIEGYRNDAPFVDT